MIKPGWFSDRLRSRNGVRVSELLEYGRGNVVKKNGVPKSALLFDGSSSSDSSCGTPVKMNGGLRKKKSGMKEGKVVPDGFAVPERRWWRRKGEVGSHLTPTHFMLLFMTKNGEFQFVMTRNLLIYSFYLEHWLNSVGLPSLTKETFWELFANFDPAAISEFSERKILLLKECGSALLSEPKLHSECKAID